MREVAKVQGGSATEVALDRPGHEGSTNRISVYYADIFLLARVEVTKYITLVEKYGELNFILFGS
jgi:hypothetical protein